MPATGSGRRASTVTRLKPLLGLLGVGDTPVLRDARPFYRVETGVRMKGWNAFFDHPPAHPGGTSAHFGQFELASLRVETSGSRVLVHCGGFRAGPFTGALVYTFFAGSRLIQQEAVVVTDEPNVAFLYDAGIEFRAPEQVQPGRNMVTPLAYYDSEGALQQESANRIATRAGEFQGALPSHGYRRGAGQRGGLSPAASVFLSPRLHLQPLAELAPLVARPRVSRNSPGPRHQLAVLSMGECPSGQPAVTVLVSTGK